MKKEALFTVLLGVVFLGLAVAIGAFGAHGLKPYLTGKYINTFNTGVEYHYYHGFALMLLGLLKGQYNGLSTRLSTYAFAVGIILFSFNCYFYAVTQIKTFAMVVPLGGVLFLLGWSVLGVKIYKEIK